MADVVQLKCPHCQNTLRVPADWVDRPVRCKHCQQVFQARPKPAAQPARQPPPKSAPPADNPFAFDAPAPAAAKPRPARAKSEGLNPVKAVVLGCGILTVVGLAALVIVLVLGSQLLKMLRPEEPPQPVAKNTEKKDTPATGKATKDSLKDSPKVLDTRKDKETPKGKELDTPKDKETPKEKDPPLKRTDDIYPRRALLISVNDYMLASPVAYGKPAQGGFKGSSTAALGQRLSESLDFPLKQVAELSDKATPPVRPEKSAIEASIVEFLSTSRAQDHVLLLFAGHAAEIGPEAYLVPLDGNPREPKTLIPLDWLYKELAGCKARQKVLILDVCRADTAGVAVTVPMGDILAAKLRQPPAGVQVWSACVAGQHSYEYDESTLDSALVQGSVFLSLLATSSRQGGRAGRPEDPIPVEHLAGQVDPEVRKVVRRHAAKADQTPRLAGHEPVEGAAYDPNQLPPPRFDLPRPSALTPGAAPFAEVEAIIREVAVPPLQLGIGPGRAPEPPDQQAARMAAIFAFPAERLKPYAADVGTPFGPERFPLRVAVLKTVEALDRQGRLNRVKVAGKEEPIKDPTLEVKAGTTEALKKSLSESQKGGPAVQIVELTDLLEEMEKAGLKRGEEPSKRWQAHYDYVLAELKSRLALVHEYNTMLAKVKRDELPALDAKLHRGWRLAPQEKLQSPKEVKDYASDAKKLYATVIKENPGTPWEVLAKRGQLTPLGLAWQPVPK